MIVKELDEFSSADKFAKARRAAEEQIPCSTLILYLSKIEPDDRCC
jgi:hypothetical protein